MTMKHLLSPLLLLTVTLLHSTTTRAQSPPPSGPTNITAILEKAGQYTTFIRLLKGSQTADQINQQLNNSNSGLTIFAPTDNAFSNLKSGTINSLTTQQQLQLVQFHILPSFFSLSQFQTASNPLRTQAGVTDSGQFPLNITTSGNQVNLTTGFVTTSVANSVYSDGQLAVYQVDKVLLPLSIFRPPSAPAPAPSKPETDVPISAAPKGSSDNATSTDVSGAMGQNRGLTLPVVSFGVAAMAAFSLSL